MKITINQEGERLVAVLNGDLDNTASMKAESELAPIFKCTDSDIVLDCTELNYISSSGLRILLSIYKHARGTGHKAVLKGVQEDVEDVFRLSGFTPLFVFEK